MNNTSQVLTRRMERMSSNRLHADWSSLKVEIAGNQIKISHLLLCESHMTPQIIAIATFECHKTILRSAKKRS